MRSSCFFVFLRPVFFCIWVGPRSREILPKWRPATLFSKHGGRFLKVEGRFLFQNCLRNAFLQSSYFFVFLLAVFFACWSRRGSVKFYQNGVPRPNFKNTAAVFFCDWSVCIITNSERSRFMQSSLFFVFLRAVLFACSSRRGSVKICQNGAPRPNFKTRRPFFFVIGGRSHSRKSSAKWAYAIESLFRLFARRVFCILVASRPLEILPKNGDPRRNFTNTAASFL